MPSTPPFQFSNRLPFDAKENSLSQIEMAHKALALPVWDLTQSNPTLAGFDYPVSELVQALACPPAARYEPNPRGLPQARDAVRMDYARRGARVRDEDILLTASSSESYAHLFKLFANPGQGILVPSPSYPLFDHLAGLEGLFTRPYHLAFDGSWHVDFSNLDFRDIAALVIVSPNNPTGSFVTAADLNRLAKCAAKNRIPLIVDEVFADYPHRALEGAIPCVASQSQPCLTFSLGGLSKSCGLPQMKLGWIAATGPHASEAVARLEWVADTYLSVGAQVMHALPNLLSLGSGIRAQIQQRIGRNLAFLTTLIAGDRPVSILPCEAGWSAILRVPSILTDEEWAIGLLREKGVLVQPGYFFELTLGTTLVVSLLSEEKLFDEGTTRLLNFIEASMQQV